MSHCQIAVPLGVHSAFGRHKGQWKAKQISSTEGAQQEKTRATREMKVDRVAFLKATVCVTEKYKVIIAARLFANVCGDSCN